ncbi:hypothetical protein KKF84_18830 [Myxococcota bacterium]|nr:hypothetical protein [Myxococcota bacterium]MBU1537378.1 hypothetical protein [Myxococcota bacterium]
MSNKNIQGTFLVTTLHEVDSRVEMAPRPSFSSQAQLHSAAVAELAKGKGQVVHSGVTEQIVFCEDSVEGVALAVRICRRNQKSTQGNTPLSFSVILFETDEPQVTPAVMERARMLSRHVGSGEIGITRALLTPWQERGNRAIKSFSRKASPEETLHFVQWESSSREPKKIKKLRGFFYVILMAVPSLALVWMLLWFGGPQPRSSHSPVAIFGPFTTSFSPENFVNFQIHKTIPGKKWVNYREMKAEGISYHHLASGSLQFSGRVQRARDGFVLTLELTLHPRGILYNRVEKKISSPAIETVKKNLMESMEFLLLSLEQPRSITQFTDLFALCGLTEIPSFTMDSPKNGSPTIHFAREEHAKSPCIGDLVRNLPAQVTHGLNNDPL